MNRSGFLAYAAKREIENQSKDPLVRDVLG
jgi:hypothetical protein